MITKMADDSQTAASDPTPMRAADILSQRLPSVPKVDPNAPKTPGSTKTGVPAPKSSPTPAKANPLSAGTEQKPGTSTGQAKPAATGTPITTSTPTKAGVEAKKPPSQGQSTATPGNANGAAATTTPNPKPVPTPKKAVTPARRRVPPHKSRARHRRPHLKRHRHRQLINHRIRRGRRDECQRIVNLSRGN